MLSYTRRHRARDAGEIGPPTVYYMDVAFFPESRHDVFAAFIGSLVEPRL